jgi:hypothetical protein
LVTILYPKINDFSIDLSDLLIYTTVQANINKQEAIAKYLNSIKYNIAQTEALLYFADSRHFAMASFMFLSLILILLLSKDNFQKQQSKNSFYNVKTFCFYLF